jgi:hypothetical protein
MINQLLTEYKDTMCIIAGYKDDVEKCFFSVNKGLESRFPWKFSIMDYNNKELYDMFTLKLNNNWKLCENTIITPEFFSKNKQYFVNTGRDIENFYIKCCIAHSSRLFLEKSDKILSNDDVKTALNKIIETKKLTEKSNEPPFGMYI